MKKFIDFLEDELGINPGVTLILLFVVALATGFSFVNGGELDLFQLGSLVVFLSPIWFPITLLIIFWGKWIEYVQVKNIIGTEHRMLEIRLPEEITRTPLAMETVLNVMFHTGSPMDWYDGLVKGSSRPQFSLELASFEGDVRFFIRCPKGHESTITTQIYSQYPTVEIHEVDDYIEKIQYDQSNMELFALEHKLGKPDPYPIKTYVDWGLDKPGLKEEEKIDPINSILEFMGSLGKGEYCFLQYVIRSHVPDSVWGEKGREDWQKVAEKETQDIIDSLKRGNGGGESDGYSMYRPPHEGEKERMEAIQRNIRKKPFDTGLRILYFASKDDYKKERHGAIPTMFRTFQSHTLNNLKPVFLTSFNWWITNPFGMVKRRNQREAFQAYRWRSFFLPPYVRPYFVFSSEELATVYHFPGRATGTPTLRREPSRKAEAPSNLPR